MKTASFAQFGLIVLLSLSPVWAAQDSEVITVGSDKFLRWHGRAGRTYFIQVSDPNDHLRKWTWAPIIETGNDEDISHEVDGTADKAFYRLWFSDQETTDPDGDDFDYDGLTNLAEVTTHQTNPLEWDSDNDGLPDKWEIDHDLDPNDDGSTNPAYGAYGDPDGDGLTNDFEYWFWGDPNLTDTDGDGLNDYDEVMVHGTYLDSSDTDWDGLNDFNEVSVHGTNPLEVDTDNDTLSDGEEVLTHGTMPLEMDTDGDWMWDDYEVDNSLDPTDAADGLFDADSDTLANQLEFVFMDKGYDPFIANNAAAFPWAGDPDWDGLTTQVEFVTYLTNPRQPDTDLDGMDDAWEIAHGFNPKLNNRVSGPANQHPDADPDGDGLTNGEESGIGTNPNAADTDGDGVDDKTEDEQGSNPNDPNDNQPPPNGTVPVNVTFGDHSGSHSEKYQVLLTPLEGDNTGYPKRQRTNRDYGQTQTDTFQLPKGAKYRVELKWVATDPKYRGDPKPDYDYVLEIPQLAQTAETIRIIKDQQGIMGVHNESDSFFASGKSADLFVMNFKTETVAIVPVNRQRLKVGVKEEVNITVTPASAGTLTWALQNNLDATIDTAIGYNLKFTADTRNSQTVLQGVFDSGDFYDLNWEVVKPSGERATKTADLTFPAGIQGVGMILNIVTLPEDVSFTNVEVIEIDQGTSNVSGFFNSFPASSLQHHPNPDWFRLSIYNSWVDTASFSNWGFPSTWRYGTYQWAIDVRWRTLGENGQGEFLANRTQLHTLNDSTGKSTELKMPLPPDLWVKRA